MLMVRHLDKNRPYATIHGEDPGAGGARYAQDGFGFFADGTLVPEEGLDEDTADPDPAPEVVEEATSEPMVGKVKADDMRLAANKALKLQMEAYGEEWQGVTHAKKYLGVE